MLLVSVIYVCVGGKLTYDTCNVGNSISHRKKQGWKKTNDSIATATLAVLSLRQFSVTAIPYMYLSLYSKMRYQI